MHRKLVEASLLGVLATIPYEVLARILLAFDIGKYSEYELSSLMITMDRPDPILGFIVSGFIGMVAAAAFYYMLRLVGADYPVLKGILIGLLAWLISELLFTWTIEGGGLIQPRPTEDYYLHLAGALIFGLTLGLLFQRYLLSSASRRDSDFGPPEPGKR
ncbi:MAG TPA: hypothetical protein PKO38_03725 [Bacillota bacterium]|jgi:hypothetical protein|nr:hypothetical protein [Bacillota bacterium]HOB86784.1 hypothetical protein [Bacillota bacterium]HOP69992.1 hypothetical protein [Bacillota bacterium]HPT34869.1 hypothetical protein [Bacillota bacterium]HQD06220.1 hypothetical protein [Bacillota bacterium]